MHKNTNEELSIELIKKLHTMCFEGSKKFAGNFGDVEVVIRNAYGELVHCGLPKEENRDTTDISRIVHNANIKEKSYIGHRSRI